MLALGIAIAVAGLGSGAAGALLIAVWVQKSEIAFLREHVRFVPPSTPQASATQPSSYDRPRAAT